jgi:hypothetical protein
MPHFGLIANLYLVCLVVHVQVHVVHSQSALEKMLGFGQFNTEKLTCSAAMLVKSDKDRLFVTVPMSFLEITTPGKGTKLVALVNSVARFSGHGDSFEDSQLDFHSRFAVEKGDEPDDPTDYSEYCRLIDLYFSSIVFGPQDDTAWTADLDEQLATQSQLVFEYHEEQVNKRHEVRKEAMRLKAANTRAETQARAKHVKEQQDAELRRQRRKTQATAAEPPTPSSRAAQVAAAAVAETVAFDPPPSPALPPAASSGRRSSYKFGQSRAKHAQASTGAAAAMMHLHNIQAGEDAEAALAADDALS